ncbi:arginase family protein [uncultured Alistipes sp.]|uniref:arginase family protein n=1 Tax=uncultured Alistipes sp. TaxID=538949 RepID=UPI002615AAE9|nr:arginase family protein [uncultured Alistipes sp.]
MIVTDFTGIYARQPFAAEATVVPCADLTGTDCYCDDEAAAELARRLAPHPLRAVHFLDSGNYHYLTKLWTDRIDRPFDLVLFDRHTDMQPPAFGDLLSCGSWVRRMLDRNPLLRRVCVAGAPADREAAAEYPGRVLFCGGTPDDPAWRHFAGAEDPTPLYVSVDKDVLAPEWAATNWDQGTMTLPELCDMLRSLLLRRTVLGADVCGEYAPEEAIADEGCVGRNDRANAALYELLRTAL